MKIFLIIILGLAVQSKVREVLKTTEEKKGKQTPVSLSVVLTFVSAYILLIKYLLNF